MISYFKKRPYLILLFGILLISFFFRTYHIIDRLDFGHDGDLSAWIVKDIVVNHHFRLIGQLTSAPGIFIGPLYYYLLVPFYLITKMDPIGGAILITIIGILSTLSYFFVFKKLFNIRVGLIASFLQAALLTQVQFDRWVVPSTPTSLWIIWYFYAILMISQGNFALLPLLGILIGLIWDIHIALIPTLIAIPIAFFVSRKIPKLKQIILTLIAFFITSTPLILFETRHGFSQTLSLIQSFTVDHGGGKGLPKLISVLEMISKNVNALFLAPQSLPSPVNFIFTFTILIGGIFLLSKKVALPLYAWVFGVIAFFTFSSTLVSEYYLYSVEIIFVAIVAIAFSKLPKKIVLIILSLIFIKNAYYFVTTDIYHKGYAERKAVANYITQDAKLKNYPCVGISYITTPGENVGFRYFFYLDNLHLAHPSLNVPVYNIVIPDELSPETKVKFGHIGVIPPPTTAKKDCSAENTNLTDSMFGYVE